MKKVFGYIRRSTDSDNLSLHLQEKAIRSFAESQGWELAGLYCDSGESGKTLNRAGFISMLEKLSPDVSLILVMKLDRISRSLKDILVLLEDILGPKGIDLKSVTESFDSSTSEGRLMLSMLGGFAEFERKRIVERMMDGKQHLAEQGGWNGGTIPYGYKQGQDGKLIKDEFSTKIVEEIFYIYSRRGMSTQKLKTITSCPLHRDTIYDLLSNPFYVGLVKYGNRLFKGDHDPIINVRLFNKVQTIKASRTRSVTQKVYRLVGNSFQPLQVLPTNHSPNL